MPPSVAIWSLQVVTPHDMWHIVYVEALTAYHVVCTAFSSFG